jgi:RNA polymerase primary sigma factor
MGTENSETIVGIDAVPVQRKPLSPAFRMAVLTGALESVRLHLLARNDVDAADEKGRSALILAASKGHLEVCRLLLEAGARPTLKDNEGNDALSAALLRGRTDIVALLHGTGTRSVADLQGDSGEEFKPDRSKADREDHATSNGVNVTPAERLDAADTPDEDRTFDLSGWHEDLESSPPPDDPKCADEAGVLQDVLSRHIPIDTNENWDDIEIELPELDYLAQRRVRLTSDARLALRSVVVEALRDGRIRADRISEALPEDEGIGDADRAEIEAGLHLVLGDLGAVIDGEFAAPDPVIGADDDDDERFGEAGTDAINFIGRRLSNDTDPFTLYTKSLPSVRLTRDQETSLGTVIREGRLEVLAAIAASPSAVSKLLSDSEAALKGELPARAILDAPGTDASREDTPADEVRRDEDVVPDEAAQEAVAVLLPMEAVAHLTAIAGLCRQGNTDQDGLTQRLFAAKLSPGYFAELQEVASQDAFAGNAKDRINAAHARAENAKKQLVEANLKLVIWVAKKHGGLPILDRIQEGNIGLMRAADRFDPRMGAKFSTYAVWWIRQGIMRAAADTGRTIRIPVHVNENLRKIAKARIEAQYESDGEPSADRIAVLAGLPPDRVRKLMGAPQDVISMDSEPEVADGIGEMADEERRSPELVLITSGMQALVRKQLDCLEPREERVIRHRFGIGCDDQTLEEVGQMYGVTRERIRQIEAKALKKLAHPGRVKRLQDEVR